MALSAQCVVLSAVCGVLDAQPLLAQVTPGVNALVAALRPAWAFPSADAEGEMPAEGGARHRWFVVWPSAGEARVIVKANPLHPDTQKAGAAAMGRIQEAIVAAERRAQAAYDRAVAEVKRTGKAVDVGGISLDDEGIAGERIDAELELSIELHTAAQAFELDSSEAPIVSPGTRGVTWLLRVPPNVYRRAEPNARDRFRPAEARLYFGAVLRPVVSREGGGAHHFTIFVEPTPGAFTVILRGNEELLNTTLLAADWTRLSTQ